MSWQGFKKAMNRASTQVMQKTGQVEHSIDREYEMEERRYRFMEQTALLLEKEAKGCLDAMRAISSAQIKIAETIDVFYGDSGLRENVSKQYLNAVEELDRQTIKEMDEPFRETVLNPVMRFCSYFVDINEAIKKRENKLLDYDRLRAKTQKIVEKPLKDASKLPLAEREEAQARDAYNELNDKLTAELPQLVDLRVPYLNPSFEALVKIQLRYCSESYNRLAEVQQYLEPQVRDEYANGQLDTYVEQSLMQMRELTIVTV